MNKIMIFLFILLTINPQMIKYPNKYIIQLHNHNHRPMQAKTNLNQKVLLFLKQQILFFLPTHTHIIYVTQRQIRVLLLAEKPIYSVAKINAHNIVRIATHKNNEIAILYANNTLEIRRADQIQKIKISYPSVRYTEEDIKRGFPRIYFKGDDVYLLTSQRLEMFSSKSKDRKVYTDIIKQMHGSENVHRIAFSNLIQNQKVAVLQFKSKISFSFIPISIAQINIKNVTEIRMLSTTKFFKQNNKQNYLLREYLVLIINNTKLQIYNLISMKKLLEIQYDTQLGSKIQLSTDYLDNFLLVTVFKPGHREVKSNILYRINVEYYYLPTSQYFKEQQPFFDAFMEIPIKNQIYLLTGDYQSIFSKILSRGINLQDQSYPKCTCVTAIYYRSPKPPKKIGRLASKPTLSENYEIVLLQIDMEKSKSFLEVEKKKQFGYTVKRKKEEWSDLREWKQIILSYLEMRQSLDKMDLGDDNEGEDQDRYFKDDDQDDQFYLTDKTQKFSDDSGIKITNSAFYETTQQQLKNQEQEKYSKLMTSLQSAAQKFKYDKFEEYLMNEEEQEQSQQAIQASFIKYMKQSLGDEHLCNYFDQLFRAHVEKSKEQSQLKLQSNQKIKEKEKQKQKQIQKKKLKQKLKQKDQKSRKLQTLQSGSKQQKNRPETQPQTPKQKQVNLNKVVSSENLTKKKVQEKKSGNNNNKTKKSQFSFPTESLFSSEHAPSQCESHAKKENEEDDEEDCHQIFDSILQAIEKSIQKGFSPLQNKLQKMQDKLDRYQQKHITHLQKYSKSVQFQSNYLNNIQSSIHGFCFELMGQFSETIQAGIQDYWQKIEDLDRKNKHQRQRTIQEFGTYIDQQIRERQAIFDENRMTIQNHLGHLRKTMTTLHKNKPIFCDQGDEDEDLEAERERERERFEEERIMKNGENIQTLSMLLSLLGSSRQYK